MPPQPSHLPELSLPPDKSEHLDVPKHKMQGVQVATSSHCFPNISVTSQHMQHQPTAVQPSDGFSQPIDIQQKISTPGDILNLMHRQNEITAALVHQHHSLTLPPRDIPIFEGDPFKFRAFVKAFEHGVEGKASKADCLFYLEQFTKGQPQELVRSCQHMDPESGYEVAKGLLQEHFGNQYKIATAYMEKALAWQSIKSEEVKALQAYSLYLRGCCNAMEDLQYLQELDMPVNMRLIVFKLPFRMRDQWRAKAHEIMERTNDRAHIKDLVIFIERHVRILSDPLFGNIQDPGLGAAGPKPLSRFKAQPRERVKESVAATTVTSLNISEGTEESKKMLETGCLCCGHGHTLDVCKELNAKKHKEKIQFLRERGVCFACLCVGHVSRDCKKRLLCKVCKQTHPTVLHIHRQAALEQEKVTSSKQPTTVTTCGHTGVGKDKCALSILPVKVKAAKGKHTETTYAFLDPGSSGTFCSERLMKKLNAAGKRTSFLLRTMGQETVETVYSLKGLEVAGLDSSDFYMLPEVLTQEKMPVTADDIVTQEELDKWPYWANVHIPNIGANVDLLIGANAPRLLEPWEVVNSSGNGPYAVRTVLGWSVNGPLNGNSGTMEAELPSIMANRIGVHKLEEMLTAQYNYDFNDRKMEDEQMSREDVRFMDIVENSVELVDGHYSLRMPFRKKHLTLPNNLSVAKQRILGLKRRFEKDQRFHQEYTSFVTDIIGKGYAERIPQHLCDGEEGRAWYIPHHGVYHPRKNTLRVVFDCGATFKGRSLNNELLQGPNLTSSLLGVLTRFRQEPIALMGDIQQMFYQVKVAETDKTFLRFLWWPEGDLTQEVTEYWMTVHLFGAVSSPSCACYALRKTAEDSQSFFPGDVVQTVKQNFYVDDCLKSTATEEEAVQLIKDLTAICHRGGFKLTKWVSNSRRVLRTVSEEHRAKDINELDLDRDNLPLEKALGLQWCIESDVFQFRMLGKQGPYTRRGMLSMLSSVYDPLGFIAPVTLPGKVLLQELCRRKSGWDDSLPCDILQQWTRWLEELSRLSEFKIKRCIKPKGFGQPALAQLHHFSDASEGGYGTVSYARLENNRHEVQVAFLLGKARVTPLKPVTIPRLELTAAVLAVQMDKTLKAELQLQVENSFFWTDSTSVLKYIRNEDKRFHTFVANRVTTIRDATNVSQWRYVSTKDNPADDASRGRKVDDLVTGSRWIEGPSFLWKPERYWPESILETSIPADDPEVKRDFTVNVVVAKDALNATDRLITYFSDWRKLKVTVAWFLKIKWALLKLSQKRKQLQTSDADQQARNVQAEMKKMRSTFGGQSVSSEDLMEAEIAIVRFTQQQRFEAEIDALSSGKSAVRKDSPIYKLDPRLEDGLLRVGGRLGKAALPEEVKHPFILAKDQHISTLILRHIHQQLGHSGRNHTLSKLRRKYWITKAPSAVRKVINDCWKCRLHAAKAGEQKMADLPVERILPDLPPFTSAGVDYFGPIEVKRGRSLCKRYGVIFTCLASRAVHLEVANSLDTDACINALRRFISRRGQVSHLLSDNGTNFVGASRELKEALAALDHDHIQRVLRSAGVDWKFNPPGASHYGGTWERMIRSIRRVLKSVLHQQQLDDDSLYTVLCEVEAILNDRPITQLSEDPNDLEPLTPNHILLLKGKPALPPGLFEKGDLYTKRRWRQVQYIADLFWKRWVREYLPLLQERQKWNREKRSLVTGDIVIVMDSTAPRGSWLLGRVTETFPDKHGVVRSVRLKTKSSVVERPVTKLCLVSAADV